ncbi:addiction module protein [Mycolicibacterium tusciae]|uniref:addiction module protein n=1 Tax=Mycolicibacterium tusciae TaxID=75922 RepID=UPI001EF7E267|nr:addiction module protein [Mycolicibacterium tusciae]
MSEPGMWVRVERMLLERGINTFLELALWITLVYIVIGVGYTVFHVELMSQLQQALTGAFPIFSDIAALLVMVVGWPYLWATSFVCGVAGCGLF